MNGIVPKGTSIVDRLEPRIKGLPARTSPGSGEAERPEKPRPSGFLPEGEARPGSPSTYREFRSIISRSGRRR